MITFVRKLSPKQTPILFCENCCVKAPSEEMFFMQQPKIHEETIVTKAKPKSMVHEEAQKTWIEPLMENVSRVFVGKISITEYMLTALLANGHILIEDVPGVGKTTLARTLAKSIDCDFKRLQFTPDLLPTDVIGVSIYDAKSGEFQWKKGPIFCHVVLADEINRTNPRTQSALLEAMSERQVTCDGITRSLPSPFIVLATQNPFEFEGTYPLPESQLDRFLLKIQLGYPSIEEEKSLIKSQNRGHPIDKLSSVINDADVRELQRLTCEIHVEEAIVDYILTFVHKTREHEDIAVGVSPRGSLALRRGAQALAFIRGRNYVTPDDIKALILPVCAHRIVLQRRWESSAGGDPWQRATSTLRMILEEIPAPL
jgi:MoxR-like ATPase